MASTSIEHTYLYPFASQLTESAAGQKLLLATSQNDSTFPYFFEGRLIKARLSAQLLLGVAKVVSTRYYIPPNVVSKLINRDPVVTAGAEMLRFEGFSACCSSYIRVDFSPESYDGRFVSNGTTNVDFNQPMQAALARVRDTDRLAVSVGTDEVLLQRGLESVIERKVDLPLRWLKGFVEVQSYQSAMELRYDIGRIEALQFLRSLPRNPSPRSSFFVVSSGNGLRLSQIDSSEAVAVSGLQRLQLLTDLSPFADRLRIFTDANRQSSEWQLQFGGTSLCITLTADVTRGFSGEGQVLSDLKDADFSYLPRIRAALKWQSQINIDSLSEQTSLNSNKVRIGLAILGSTGMVGFDVFNRSYFHRELPFDLDDIEGMHPRLKNARRLLDDGKVTVLSCTTNGAELRIVSSDVTHHVKLNGEQAQCTCPWHGKYQGSRGPCKHILAARLKLADHSSTSKENEEH